MFLLFVFKWFLLVFFLFVYSSRLRRFRSGFLCYFFFFGAFGVRVRFIVEVSSIVFIWFRCF